jgi:hypothetical protein
MSGTVDLILEQYHRALDAVVSGNSAPMKELISRRDDVTIANPLGPPVRGPLAQLLQNPLRSRSPGHFDCR